VSTPLSRSDSKPVTSRRVLAVRAVAGIVTVVMALAIWQGGAWEPLPEGDVTRLTNDPGFEGLPSLSPDGQWVAYRGTARGNGDVFVRGVDGQQTINLTEGSPDDDSEPAFSPDGSLIAFSSAGSGISIVRRSGQELKHLTSSGFSPDWTLDGRQIVYTSRDARDSGAQVSEGFIIDVATGVGDRISEGDFRQPSVSPHGLRVAYWSRPFETFSRRRLTGARGDVWTVRLDGSDPKQVTRDAATESRPLWSADGRFIYYISARSGTSGVWRVKIDERTGRAYGQPEYVPIHSSEPVHLTRSADGRSIVWADARASRQVLRIAFDSDARTTRGDVQEVMPGAAAWADAEPSPDGAALLLSSSNGDIHVAPQNGADIRTLAPGPSVDRFARWSPDGLRIAFQSDRSGSNKVWLINADGTGLRPLSRAEGELHHPVWSPDGGQLVVWDPTLPGSRIFSVREAPAAGPLTTLPSMAQGAFLANHWSPDGQRIAGSAAGSVWVYSVGSRNYESLKGGTSPVWLNDSRRLIYASNGRLFIADTVLKAARELLAMPEDELDLPRLSRDNLTLYFTRGGTESDLWMMRVR
jgi:Tol biopolymer transport system component